MSRESRKDARLYTLLMLLLAWPAVSEQQPAPEKFRVSVQIVTVPVVVTDRDGRPVRNLTAKDFTVLEDGVPQMIAAFEMVDRPFPPAKGRMKRPIDVASSNSSGRLFAVVLDDLHIQAAAMLRARLSVQQFVQEFVDPSDLILLATTSGRGETVQDFSEDRDRLVERLSRVTGLKPEPGVRSNHEHKYYARSALSVIRRLAEHFSRTPHRIGVLLFTEGFVVHDPAPTEPGAAEVIQAFQDALAELTRGNTSLYLIDPRGLSMEGTRVFNELRALSNNTDGFVAPSLNDYREMYERIIRDHSVFYSLAYYPKTLRPAGTFRQISVRLARDDVVVRVRKGYREPSRPDTSAIEPSDVPPSLAQALTSPVPLSGLPLRTQAISFREGRQGRAQVLLDISPAAFKFTESEEHERLEIGSSAFNNDGRKVAGTFTVFNLGGNASERALLQRTGFRWIWSPVMKPGRYHIRIAVAIPRGSRTGLVISEVDIPRVDHTRLGMSGVLISSGGSPSGFTAGAEPHLKRIAFPTTARSFTAGDPMTAAVEIYPPDQNKRPVNVTWLVETVDGAERVRNVERLGSQAPAASLETIWTIPTGALTPDWYVLRVAARLEGSSDSTEQALAFRIATPTAARDERVEQLLSQSLINRLCERSDLQRLSSRTQAFSVLMDLSGKRSPTRPTADSCDELRLADVRSGEIGLDLRHSNLQNSADSDPPRYTQRSDR